MRLVLSTMLDSRQCSGHLSLESAIYRWDPVRLLQRRLPSPHYDDQQR